MMIEHNNRKQADKFAEYITGQGLRQYLAKKVRHYVGDNPSVFDGAVGSGQLEQHLNAKHIIGVEIQPQACQAFIKNYPTATIHNRSFFEFDGDISVDCVVMNPPFSIKFKDLSDSEKANIQADFEWKKSGNVDDIFVLKSMQYARFGFFILFPGLCYRASEKKFRELLNDQIVELSKIDNAFTDTNISVIFLVVDKQNTKKQAYGELYDAKTNTTLFSHEIELDSDVWQLPSLPPPKEPAIDPIALEQQLRQGVKSTLTRQLRQSKLIACLEPSLMASFNGFCDELISLIHHEKLDNSILGANCGKSA